MRRFAAAHDLEVFSPSPFDAFGFVVPPRSQDPLPAEPKPATEVVFEHRPLWSCGLYHLHSGEAWLHHVALPASEDCGIQGECGCAFDRPGLSLDRLTTLVGDADAARAVFDACPQFVCADSYIYDAAATSWADDSEVFADVDAEMASAAYDLGLPVPPEVCRLELFRVCGACGGSGSAADGEGRLAGRCPACDGRRTVPA